MRERIRQLIVHHVVAIACIFLLLGVLSYSAGLFGWFGVSIGSLLAGVFLDVGVVLVSGGFLGLIVYAIVSQYDRIVLSEEILGISEESTLLGEFSTLPRQGHSYFYSTRELEYDMREVDGEENWVLDMVGDSIEIIFRNDTEDISLLSKSDDEIGSDRINGHLTNLSTGDGGDVDLHRRDRISSPTRVYYELKESFRAGEKYELTRDEVSYGACMNPDDDFVALRANVLVENGGFRLDFPEEVDLEDYNTRLIVIDSAYNIKDRYEVNPNPSNGVVEIEDLGPLQPGDRAILRYWQ